MNTSRVDSIALDPALATPALLIDLDHIALSYQNFLHYFPNGRVFYAMKANAAPVVVHHLVQQGAALEIASEPELNLALETGLAADQIICSNPIKSTAFIEQMHMAGVYAMVADSEFEVRKIASHAPGGRIYVRLAVDNTGSVLPLAGKFGVDQKQALYLLNLARELGLQAIGISFHVGSQCLSPHNWFNAIRACGALFYDAAEQGHDLYFLNLGGGFPAGSYRDASIPTLAAIAEVVYGALEQFMPVMPRLLALEPGRGLVGEAGRLIATIMGEAPRGEDSWLYLDAGVFNGLMETYEGFPPVVELLPMVSNGNRPYHAYTLAGPSCDSCDVIAHGTILPKAHPGDRLNFLDAGAYTNEYASRFNGFAIPQVHYFTENIPELKYETT